MGGKEGTALRAGGEGEKRRKRKRPRWDTHERDEGSETVGKTRGLDKEEDGEERKRRGGMRGRGGRMNGQGPKAKKGKRTGTEG